MNAGSNSHATAQDQSSDLAQDNVNGASHGNRDGVSDIGGGDTSSDRASMDVTGDGNAAGNGEPIDALIAILLSILSAEGPS